MKLWIDERFETSLDEIKSLFVESVICYRSGAYRASLLYSYLGFLTHIKVLIIKTKRPSSVPQGRWDLIIASLNDEDKWEETVFNELKNSTNPIFNIAEHLRTSIKYWKDRRNDCAHFKQNEVNSNHVEIFWAFLKSNLSKITIEGGKEDLLQKIELHFNAAYTPPGKDYGYLISEVENAVSFKDFQPFLEELFVRLYLMIITDDMLFWNFFYNLYTRLKTANYRLELISFLRATPDRQLQALKHKPKFLHEFNYTPEEIRNLWHNKIYRENRYTQSILVTLLRNNSIPHEQVKSAMELFFGKFDQSGFKNLTRQPDERKELANQALLDLIYDTFFISNKLSEMPYPDVIKKADLIVLLFEFRSIDSSMILELWKSFQSSAKPQWLFDGLRQLFQTNLPKFDEFKQACVANGIPTIFVSVESK